MDLTAEQLAALVDVPHPDGRIHLDPDMGRLALTPTEAGTVAALLLDGADFLERTSW